MTELRLALIGMGRMGRALSLLAPERGFRVVAELDASERAQCAVTRASLGPADVAIEFTEPGAAPANGGEATRPCPRAVRVHRQQRSVADRRSVAPRIGR